MLGKQPLGKVTKKQFEVAEILFKGEETSVREIAKKLGVNMNAILGRVKHLEKQGWVRKGPDARSLYVLTSSAKVAIKNKKK